MDKVKVVVGVIADHLKDKVIHPKEISTQSETLSPSPSPPTNNRNRKHRAFHIETAQNFRLVWLDSSADEVSIGDSLNTIRNLRKVVHDLNTFTAVGKCMEFISSVENEKIFMICSEELSETIIPMIHNMPQINCIYLFCAHKAGQEEWTKKWPKVKGLYTDITSLYEELKKASAECDQNLVSMSFIMPTKENPNEKFGQLDQSFMLTQLLKEILLTTNFESQDFNEFLTICHKHFADNAAELRNIQKIETEYHERQPIWWYTYECFVSSMLNRALRTMEIELIIQMGFFIQDLHHHIATLHTEQYQEHGDSDSFTVYRGQGLSENVFNQLKNTHGGLMSFNGFLPTGTSRKVSLDFAQETIATLNLIGVLFVMKINPSRASSPFANIGDVSYSRRVGEEEILFSMHSIFRIENVQQIDKHGPLWQVDLTLTSKNDPELQTLKESLRQETYPNLEGWDRLGMLLIKLGHFKKAEELYEIRLEKSADDRQKAHSCYMLGLVKSDQGNYEDAIEFYTKSVRINRMLPPPIHPDLSASYTDLGLAYSNIGHYAHALSSYKKALDIQEKTLPSDHPDLSITYNNMGNVYYKINKLSDALSYFEKSFAIRKSTLPPNHPLLATAYNNIAELYRDMGKYSKALSSHQTALNIYRKTLPSDHPDLATSYNNVGWVYTDMGDFSQALTYFKRALDIFHLSLAPDHPKIKTVEDSIEFIKTRISK